VRTIPLTIRGVPEEVHDALKKSAKANRRSLNGETLTWIEKLAGEQKVTTCAEAAEILRRADAVLNPQDRKRIVAGIEESRRKMNTERLEDR
jgi:plasmid stability protein